MKEIRYVIVQKIKWNSTKEFLNKFIKNVPQLVQW